MEILAIVLLLCGIFSTVVCITTEDLALLLPAGLFYLCYGVMIREKKREV